MRQLYDDLWQTKIFSMGSLNTHGYFLKTGNSNILVYSTPHQDDLDAMENLGGISHQLKSHRDELSTVLTGINARFGSKLLCDAEEAESVKTYCNPDSLVKDELKLYRL